MFVFLSLVAALSVPARAQPHRAFETLRFSVGGAADAGGALLHDYWEPGYGGDVSVMTPFYAGFAEVGGAIHRYEIRADVPRFDALLVYAGWGAAVRPLPLIDLYGGIRVGNYRMMFDDDTFAGVRNESELTLGAHARLDLRLGRGWSVYAAGSYLQTYTFIRLRSTYVGAGLSRIIRTPGWLRGILY